jgi:DNA-binding transcriptional ArsR family regulator
MSRPTRNSLLAKRQTQAVILAALGDNTRLALVIKLCDGEPCSIAELTANFDLTRQAVTKHLRVLEDAGLVRSTRTGRESRYQLDPQPIDELRKYLDLVSAQWDQALSRLKSFVEG